MSQRPRILEPHGRVAVYLLSPSLVCASSSSTDVKRVPVPQPPLAICDRPVQRIHQYQVHPVPVNRTVCGGRLGRFDARCARNSDVPVLGAPDDHFEIFRGEQAYGEIVGLAVFDQRGKPGRRWGGEENSVEVGGAVDGDAGAFAGGGAADWDDARGGGCEFCSGL